jgi:apolipoprotein N-acyltransferase
MPLIVAVFDDRFVATPVNRRRGLMLGFVAGVGYFGGTVYWTGSVVQQFGGLAWPVAVLVAGLLVAYLALFPALFGLLLAVLGESLGTRAMLLAPAVWVTTELARTYFWSGFPWVLLGYSQTTVLPVAQIASVVGVFGLSALVACASAAMAFAVVVRSRFAFACLGGAAAVVLGVVLWGDARLARHELTEQGRPVRVALIQGNIPQDQKWDTAQAGNILATYLRMTAEAAAGGAQLVIWPESSTPFYFEDDRVGGTLIREAVKRAGVELLLGSDQMERSQPPAYYNAAFLVRRDGQVAGAYRKMHLVPFGEYVPLKNLLFFVGPLVEAAGAFTPGQSMVLLPTSQGAISTAICYEIVYPALVRQSVVMGSELLTTITNDAWYGYSSAPYQHFMQASMRAIEQGRYLARSANTGISGIVDPYGRVLQQSEIFERTVMVGDVRMLTGRTVYGKIGDVFAYACAALALAALAVPRFVPRRRHGTGDR